MTQPKIVFFGTPEFAAHSLQAICDAGFVVSAVVTMPDKPAGRGMKLFQSPVKTMAIERGIPVLQPVKLKDPEFIDQLRALKADLFVVIAFRMLPEAVWKMPPLGTFNLHASLLPKYRGAAPINWAIIKGEKLTGITTFFLKHEIDTGDVIDRTEIDILPDDNAGTLHDKLMELGAQLTVKTIKRIAMGNLTAKPQSEFAGVTPTPAPKIFRETCKINFHDTAENVHNLVRGLSPYPAAWAAFTASNSADFNLKIFKTALAPSLTIASGQVSVDKTHLYIGTSTHAIEILEVQPTGKKRMDVASWLRGARYNNLTTL